MSSFVMHLQSPGRMEQVDNVTSFTGLDTSGRFGILANHERMMTVLEPGIMRFRVGDGELEYLGIPGGLLYFVANNLSIKCERFIRDVDYDRLHTELQRQFVEESELRNSMKTTVEQMEKALLQKLLKSDRRA